MLFDPLVIKSVTFRNRLAVSPMCQYSSNDGFAADWHLVHLGSRATGGAGMVMMEATAVEPRGRISPFDMGIWKDEHITKLKEITAFICAQGSVPGIQIAHAGRKASMMRPSDGDKRVDPAHGGWVPVAPSPVPFSQNSPLPKEMTVTEIQDTVQLFKAAALRAYKAGFKVVEVHAAHGYLLHEFLSPLSNQRKDDYGGSLENRFRFPLNVIEAVRSVWPLDLPLFVRISATDWMEPDGWDIEQSVEFSRRLKKIGVDLIDCSSGALVPQAVIPFGPGFQVPFAARIKRETGILTGAVGCITTGNQADSIIKAAQADIILVGRKFLRDPNWAHQAAIEIGARCNWPVQYASAV